MEIWKEIEGYDGRYSVSNQGRVRRNPYRDKMGRLLEEKLVPQQDNGRGYKRIKLWKDGRTIDAYVHRLVASAFLFKPEGTYEINHKDENKANNCADNLEWCDRTYNNNYGNAANHKRHPVVMCDKEGNAIKTFESIKQAAEQTGSCCSRISSACRGTQKTAKGYVWRYA